jgi:drug/metabolite transporter (DMT)-like permease
VTAAPQLGPSRSLGYVLVAVAAVAWGTWPLILRRAVMPSSLQAAILMVMLTLLSLPVMLKDRVRVRAKPVHWFGVGWLGVADALNVALFFGAYQRTSVAIAVLTHYFTPVFVALAAPIVLRERAHSRTFGAVAVSFAGLVLLLEPWKSTLAPSDVLGAALGAGSAVFYASNVLVNKRLAHVFSGSELMFYHGFVAIPLLWALVPSGTVAAASTTSILVVVVGSLGPGVLGGLLFVWGLRRIAASHASVLTLLEPFVAVVTAAIFLNQGLAKVQILGGLFILFGALLVITARGPKADITPAGSTTATP